MALNSLSPQSFTTQSPIINGFTENAWENIQQPVLMLSGDENALPDACVITTPEAALGC